MNVLMLVKNSEVGGVLSCVKSLSDGLKEIGDTVVIGTCAGEGVDKMLYNHEVEIINFSAKSPLKMIKCYSQIKALVKKHKIDIIHAQNRIPALYASVFCFFHRKVKYIWSNHLVPLPSSFLYRLTTRYGKYAVAEGIAGRNFLVDDFKIPAEKVKIVNLGSHLDEFKKISLEEQKQLKKHHEIKDTEKVILLYGRLMPVKGHMFLLDALAKLSDEKKDNLKVVFPGENAEYKQEIDSYAKELGLEKMLVYPGYIKGQQYLSISDLMILPSKQEGFGIVNVEAFAMGVPVIRTKTAGYLDMEDCCFGIEYGDTDALVKLINCLWDDPERLEKMAKDASEKAERFSVKKMTEEYKSIYQKCMR